MRPLVLLSLLALAACGADGPPQAAPDVPAAPPQSGVTFSGQVTMGYSS
ncbi:hypothetical protein [Wenxinia marina]|uniref:Argininosuccinate lyase n=1 Tax=Wenxinia marina DSM 24838 TaxID=1123501 RepID=A0A0D0NPY3_9RHOB|nr:hypothetical protein [Wenxinia marina]KIQ70325.1 hypothetical protein Wenmar_00700 [Wenxinia marina DSM 24838]GGL54013.1 hypothetical protein GCM10011392_05510 [Wenxinia marina]